MMIPAYFARVAPTVITPLAAGDHLVMLAFHGSRPGEQTPVCRIPGGAWS